MFKVLEVAESENLAQFSRLLWQQSLSHRIYHEGEMQIVAVARPEDIAKASSLYQQWKTGTVQVSGNNYIDTDLLCNGSTGAIKHTF